MTTRYDTSDELVCFNMRFRAPAARVAPFAASVVSRGESRRLGDAHGRAGRRARQHGRARCGHRLDYPRCRRPGHRAGDAHRRRVPARRRADRVGVHRRRALYRLRPAGAVRGPAGHREDRGVAVLRRREHLPWRAAARERPQPPGDERDAARLVQRLQQRSPGGDLRHLQRPPQRLRLRRQPAWRDVRLDRHQRAAEPQLERPVVVEGRRLRRRLDHRDAHPVPLDPLQGRRHHLGRELPAHGAVEGRDLVPERGAPLVGPTRV